MKALFFYPVSSLALLVAGAGALAAQGLTGFELNGDFQVAIGGEVVSSAEVYRSQRPPAFLVLTSELPAPVLVMPGASRVETIHIMKLAKRPDGVIDLLPGATLAPQGGYRLDGQEVVFTVEGKEVRLQPKPPLLGLRRAEDLKSYSVLYVKRSAAYEPDAATLERLKRRSEPVRVRVFFGSWCPSCQRMVPNAVKVADELAGSNVRIEFYGLPQGFGNEPEAKKGEVTAVPTGIVYVGGKEVGRIQGNGWYRPEQTIQDILAGRG